MSMIFPGMDPYLEDPQIWEGFQARFIVYLCDALQPQIRPRYIASVERRVIVEVPGDGRRPIIPDVWVGRTLGHHGPTASTVAEIDGPVIVEVPGLEVHQSYVQLLDTTTGLRVVTVIEVVSPSNKFPGPGRDLYLTKQGEVLRSPVHLVEIDLLRTGPHVLSVPEYAARGKQRYDYLVCVNRSVAGRDKFELYPRRLRERLPRIPVPLAGDDPDVSLDLQAVLEYTYRQGAYRDQLRYHRPCHPTLDGDDAAWADELIARALRTSPDSSA
jgi:hypothetical protein